MGGHPCALPVLPGCAAKAQNPECESTRSTRKLFDYLTDSQDLQKLNESVVWTHKSCVCNEIVALKQRHQVDDGARPEKGVGLLLVQALKPYRVRVYPESFEQVIQRYTGGKRAIAERAYQSLQKDPLNPKDSAVRMFLKDDKYHTPKMCAPRCIQYRDKRYGITMARYYNALEHAMLQSCNMYRGVATTNRLFAKGRNQLERASDLRQIWDSFIEPVALSIDHSKFDAHCNTELLKAANKHNAACLPKAFRGKFKKLAAQQLVNNGKTHNGTKYRTTGTRMSGDQNTGGDNSLINLGMTLDWLNSQKVQGQVYIDGDDFVCVVEARDVGKLDVARYSKYGMSTKLEGMTDMFEHIDFCQCRPVFDGERWRMVRNPERVLARLPWMVKKQPEARDKQWLKSIGMCELALNLGLPVMQAIATKLIKLSPKKYIVTPLHYMAKHEVMKPWRATPVEVRYEARLSYERAWGISPQQQLDYEKLEFGQVVSNPMSTFISWGGERPAAQ